MLRPSWVYRAYHTVAKTGMLSLLKELEQSESWDLPRIREYQWGMLKALIEHSWNKIPYYRQCMEKAGLSPASIRNFDDYRRLPLLNRNLIREHQDEIFLKENTRKGRWKKTSGSSGVPLHFFSDAHAFHPPFRT